MMWKIWAAMGAASSAHAGTMMTARNQKNAAYAGDVSLSDALRQSTTSNLNNSPYFEALSRAYNYNTQKQNLDMLEQATPGYAAWTAQQSQKARDMAAGRIDSATAKNLERKNYENAYGSGRFGQAAQFNLAKTFGQMQFQNTAYSQGIMQQLASLNKVNLSGVGAFYSTPQDAINTALSNRSANQAWLNAQQAAKNVRKNAIWASSSVWAQQNADFMSMKQNEQGADQTAYKSYNYTPYSNNQYSYGS